MTAITDPTGLPADVAGSPGQTAHIVEALARGPALIIPLVREVPPAVRTLRTRAGKWSAHEQACHLAVVEGLFATRLDAMLREDTPAITPYDPGPDALADDTLLRMDLEESLDRWAHERARTADRLRGLAPADWERTARHPEYTHYSVRLMCRHFALHDMLHAYRIEEVLLKKDWLVEEEGGGT
ncbi:MAG: DinB family protein [Gemmatimonadaceae bacterium]